MKQSVALIKEKNTINISILTKLKNTLNNIIFYIFCTSSILLLGSILIGIVYFVGKTGLKVFSDVSFKDYFFSLQWDPFAEHYGVGAFIIGTFALMGLTLLFCVPFSLIVAIYISEYASGKFKKVYRSILDLLVGIPSVVYGFIGLTIFVPFIRDFFHQDYGHGIAAASLVLAIMVLPTITRIADTTIESIPNSIREASYSLGATKFQVILKSVLPAAKSGIFTAIILGMTRAIGETMAVVMVIGNTPILLSGITSPTSVMTTSIVTEILNVDFDSTWNYALYMMAFLLLLISLIFIVLIRFLKGKGEN